MSLVWKKIRDIETKDTLGEVISNHQQWSVTYKHPKGAITLNDIRLPQARLSEVVAVIEKKASNL